MNEIPTTISLKCCRQCEKLYLKDDLADVHFVFDVKGETRKIPAHKIILASGSPVFKSMFYGDLKEEGDVKIVDASPDAFQVFLQFFYLSEVKLTIQHIAEIIKLLDKYNVPDGLNICEEYLKLTLTARNIVFGVELAVNFNNVNLKDVCAKEIYKNPQEVFGSESFLQCSNEALAFILELVQLPCKESKIFKACMKWAKHSCEKNGLDATSMECRRNQLGDSLHLIQFGVMDPDEIFECVRDSNQLFERDELQELFAIADPCCVPDLKLFKHTTRENARFPWDSYKRIRCSRDNDDGGEYFLKRDECVKFRLNSRILFGGISMKRFWRLSHSSSEYALEAKLTIIETSPNQDAANITKLIRKFPLKTNRNSSNNNYTEFGPVLLKPNLWYKLILRCDFEPLSFATSGSNKISVFVGDTRTQIIFDSAVGKSDGMVSDLFFNLI